MAVIREQDLKGARILIIDDQPANVRLLERILRKAGYTGVRATSDPHQAVPLFEELGPDLVLLDLHMPDLDGFTVMAELYARIPENSYLPILVLTGDTTSEARDRALSSGAKDFLTKPFETAEALLRIENLLETRSLHLQLQNQNEYLEARVRERTRDLEAAQLETLERLARAAEFHDDDTAQHTRRVAELSAQIAEELALSAATVELIRRGALLHDVGKIAIPDTILLVPRGLTPDEFEVIKRHTIIGAEVLSESRFPILQTAEQIALSHHESWDGTGYPRALRGEDIPLAGRIVSVADVFDALTHDRPYREALPVDVAVAEIERQRGRKFDPCVVDAFLAILRRRGVIEPAPAAGPRHVAHTGER